MSSSTSERFIKIEGTFARTSGRYEIRGVAARAQPILDPGIVGRCQLPPSELGLIRKPLMTAVSCHLGHELETRYLASADPEFFISAVHRAHPLTTVKGTLAGTRNERQLRVRSVTLPPDIETIREPS